MISKESSFSHKISNGIGVCLFGIVPPPYNVKEEKVISNVQDFANAIKDLEGIDGINIYDIREEKGRTEEERPFPFVTTWEPRYYGKIVKKYIHSEIILYCAINEIFKSDLEKWLHSTYTDYDSKILVLVGKSSTSESSIGYSVLEAAEYIKKHELGFLTGGITIPERHRDKDNEHQLLLEKYRHGISFFTSQLVYNSDNAISLLADYDELCREKGIQPAQIIFAFAPFGSEQTVAFLRWLGVELPDGTVKRVLKRFRGNSKHCVIESMEICRENFKRILEYIERYDLQVPVGFAVESVSKSKIELEGAVELFKMLKYELDQHKENFKKKQTKTTE